MQDLHKPELQIGEMVEIDWPRTRWDRRRGLLHELRQEPGERQFGYVLLDGVAMRVSLERIIKDRTISKVP